MDIPDKIFFKIGEVSEIAGVKPYVLRYWETEFSIVPKKSNSGQRLYRRKDIERILLIKRLLYEEGFTIAGARKYMSRLSRSASEALINGEPLARGSAKAASDAAPAPKVEKKESKSPPQVRVSKPDAAWLKAMRREVTVLQAAIKEAKSFKV